MFNCFVFKYNKKALIFVLLIIIVLLAVVFVDDVLKFFGQRDMKDDHKKEHRLTKEDNYTLDQINHHNIELVVDPYRVYNYQDMKSDLETLNEMYQDIMELRIIGESVLGKEIFAVGVGNLASNENILIEASHHAREWLATNLAMKKLDNYLKAYVKDDSIGEYRVREILDEVGIWFIPMVNPDGVTLHQEGLRGIPKEFHDKFVDYNVDWAGSDFFLWKANINGVDLNRQYPADWDDSDCTGVRHAMNFKGEEPLSEPEAQAVYQFTKEIEPLTTTSYHTRGRVIFWYYHNKYVERDQEIGEKLSELTGYQLHPAKPNYRGANFNDWFIQEFDRPGYILELVPFEGEDGSHDDLDYLEEEWENNRELGIYLSNIANERLK